MRITTLIVREIEDQLLPVLQNCTSIKDLKRIHAHIIKYSMSQSNFLATKIIDICGGKGETDYAISIFKQVIQPNIFLYNAVIRAYTHNHLYYQAVTIYKQLLRHQQAENHISADRFTFPFILRASAGLLYLNLGKQIHGHLCKCWPTENNAIDNSLLEMYVKCGNLIDAHQVFDGMREKDSVSWNILISGYARSGRMKPAKDIFNSMPNKTIVSWTVLISGYTQFGEYLNALEAFRQMQLAGMKMDEISIVSILPACAQVGALELGKWIHVYVDKNRLLHRTCICNALIKMYADCGSINEAHQLFDNMCERDVISWSTMIGRLANHGRAQQAIGLFVEMERIQMKPNGVTFLGLLSACAHAGFLDEGLKYFDSMMKDYCINPSVEHYGCVVDLLGRSGHLSQALEFIDKMPIAPDAAVWGSLLSACRTHNNVEMAVTAMEHLLELEPDDPGNYVLLSNIYAAAGKWDGVLRMRKLMRSKRMKKMPGCSLIEVNNNVHEFIAGDDSNQLGDDICRVLELLASQLSRKTSLTIASDEGC
ncbi:pentatricopeptide repeat-containing protein At2g20540 [Magnolia sinica]|uniref:pentatricopeptide repeat-containing protein At2g20540 n=1 Tax=Magnolia sinica TaxID=86752 RepID=UPI00265844D9|nr:pentatricopeptide repeat-containing protein At2g20540 [Magnolia sinica]